MSEQTDEEIVARVQKGDIEAFAVLVERYQAKLERYARKFLLDRDDTQDLVQDVLLKAYQNIQGFDLNRKFSPWVYRIAHNIFVNFVKRRSISPIGYFDPELIFPFQESGDRTDKMAIDADMKEEIDKHLEILPPKYREPLVLYFYDEMNYQEIADVLQIPVATVGVRLSRAKGLLKKTMNKEHYE